MFMMWFKNDAEIPDSNQGISPLIFQPILFNFEGNGLSQYEIFLAFCFAWFFQIFPLAEASASLMSLEEPVAPKSLRILLRNTRLIQNKP